MLKGKINLLVEGCVFVSFDVGWLFEVEEIWHMVVLVLNSGKELHGSSILYVSKILQKTSISYPLIRSCMHWFCMVGLKDHPLKAYT